jgi:hypothetical protein
MTESNQQMPFVRGAWYRSEDGKYFRVVDTADSGAERRVCLAFLFEEENSERAEWMQTHAEAGVQCVRGEGLGLRADGIVTD